MKQTLLISLVFLLTACGGGGSDKTSNPESTNITTPIAINSSVYSCGTKKFCTQMTSCSEAKFHLTQCGLSNLDRDNDGIPCESICNSSTVVENTPSPVVTTPTIPEPVQPAEENTPDLVVSTPEPTEEVTPEPEVTTPDPVAEETAEPVQPTQPAEENTPDPVVSTPEPAEEVTPDPVATTPDPIVEPSRNCSTTSETIDAINLTGEANQQTRIFHLEKGLTIISTSYQGERNFIVTLRDANGKYIEGIANAIGSYTGKTGVEIEEAGDYMLDISSSDTWEATLTQPRPETAEILTSVSGNNKSMTDFFYLQPGIVLFDLQNTAAGSNFITTLRNAKGEYIEGLTNEIGNFNGSKLARIEKADCYFINVLSEGSWTANIDQPADPTGTIISNFVGTGLQTTDFFLLSGNAARFTFSHQGEGYFSAVLHNKSGEIEAFIASEIGVVTKTVQEEINGFGVYIIQVQADQNAAWTITIE